MKITKYWLTMMIMLSPLFVFALAWHHDWWEAGAWACLGITVAFCRPVFASRDEWRAISEKWRANAEHWEQIALKFRDQAAEWQAIAESAMVRPD